jgi:hypothetical protein
MQVELLINGVDVLRGKDCTHMPLLVLGHAFHVIGDLAHSDM